MVKRQMENFTVYVSISTYKYDFKTQIFHKNQ